MEDYYGILATYNPHTKKWYAFDNGDVADYFTNPSKIIYGRGNNAIDAIKNYLSVCR
jgi:hypothetical protein